MASTLPATLTERQAKPYAVGVRKEDESQPTYYLFRHKENASLFSDFEQEAGHTVTRWVALLEPEHMASAVVPGWRQVTYFA